jgi:hemerythrin-like metal-binding protein
LCPIVDNGRRGRKKGNEFSTPSDEVSMAMFDWHAEYSVKDPVIDEQHQGLFRTANGLHMAILRGSSNASIGQTLTALVEYTRCHFRDEEALMRKTKYPLYQSHKAEHRKFTQRAVALKQEFDEGKITISIDVLLFIKNWLAHHIIGCDTLIAEHIAQTSERGPALPTRG